MGIFLSKMEAKMPYNFPYWSDVEEDNKKDLQEEIKKKKPKLKYSKVSWFNKYTK